MTVAKANNTEACLVLVALVILMNSKPASMAVHANPPSKRSGRVSACFLNRCELLRSWWNSRHVNLKEEQKGKRTIHTPTAIIAFVSFALANKGAKISFGGSKAGVQACCSTE